MKKNSWLKKTGIVTVSILSAGALLAGCSLGTAVLPLTLNLDSETAARDEAVTITLYNPLGSQLFLPAVWTGIAFYQKLPSGQWVEYSYPDGYQPMLSTTDSRIIYSIPTGFLDPGSYKLFIQGRKGPEGKPFTLEAELDVSILGLLGVGLQDHREFPFHLKESIPSPSPWN